MAAGANTPYLLPQLQLYMQVTGHRVFCLKPINSKYFWSPYLSVFAADISNSTWYGFPFLWKNLV